jgi:phage shock protein PspC (stress-responsive transcriptional regulator)
MDTAPEETAGSPGSSGSAETTTTTDQAGQSPSAGARPGGDQRLHREGQGRMLAGVAAGLADYFDVDPTIVRVGFVALAFLGGLAVPLYVAGWLLIPDDDTDVSVAEELLARERAHGAF